MDTTQIELEIIEGPDEVGKVFSFLGPHPVVVGRSRQADVRLSAADLMVSRVHFEIQLEKTPPRLVDRSENGTTVNGEQVDECELQTGDEVRLGKWALLVSVAELPRSLEGTTTGQFAGVATSKLEQVDSSQSQTPRIDGFELLACLGEGKMGRVYRAERQSDGACVAIKLIKSPIDASAKDILRFLQEAEIQRKVAHPHIVGFHQIGCAGTTPYLVMDLVEGTSAAAVLEADGPLEIGRAVRIGCQALEALEHAHGLGYVHRDVKPSNLLIVKQDDGEHCYLSDFGLARAYEVSVIGGLTGFGEIGGTPAYMPPEHVTGFSDVTPAADQYALAATLYRLLTGCYVFDLSGLSPEQMLDRILKDEPALIWNLRPDVPTDLGGVIHRGLDKEPEKRFESAEEFRRELLDCC